MTNNILGSNIKAQRLDKKLSIDELSSRLGISPRTLDAYERGYREPNCDMLVRIADELGVITDYLLGRTKRKKLITKKVAEGMEEAVRRNEPLEFL